MARSGRARGLLALAVAVASLRLGGQAQAPPSSTYIVADDARVAALAYDAAEELCEGGFKGTIDREEARADLLEGVGGNNIMLQSLKKAPSQAELSTTVENEITVTWLMWKAGAIVMSIIMAIVWVCCWWSLCPCCRCCRKERETRVLFKILAIVILGVLVLGMITCGSLAATGYGRAQDGFNNMACTSAKLLNSTLTGQTSPHFLGMVPLVEIFATIDSHLDDDSTFMNDIADILGNTESISSASTVALETMNLLSAALGAPANARPKDASAADLLHECLFCTALAPSLTQVLSALDEGIGVRLAAMRDLVKTVLSASQRAALQSTLRTSIAPLVQVKDAVRDTFGFFVEKDKFEKFKDQFDGDKPGVQLGVAMAILLCLSLGACGASSLLLFLFCEKRKDAEVQERNPYCKSVHRSACVTWCCAFCYCILTFLFGGILVAVTVPLSGMCLMLDDVNSAMLHDIGPAIGLNLTGDEGDMAASMLDRCFNPTDPTGTTYLLDLIFVRENGTKVNIRQKLMAEVKDPLLASLNLVSNASLPDLATSSMVTTLRQLIAQNGVDAMLIPDTAAMSADSRYQGLTLDTRGSSGTSIGLTTSSLCADHTVSAGMAGSLAGVLVPGISGFVSKLQYFGTEIPHSSCAKKVTCSGSLSVSEAQACQAGNRYIDLKQQLLATNTFQCNLFDTPGSTGVPCDPKFMSKNGTVWINDCVNSDGDMVVLERSCNLAEFVQYIQDFDTRIDKVLKRLDDAVGLTKTNLDVGMRSLVESVLTIPLETVANAVTCGFLASYYQEMIDGLCYQGVRGLREIANSYVGCASLALMLIILMYIIWRRSQDNADMWSANAVKNILPECNAKKGGDELT